MTISAELSLYPLGEAGIGQIIHSFIYELEKYDIQLQMGQMSTIISGESMEVFAAIEKAFTLAAEQHGVVLVSKISNACPV